MNTGVATSKLPKHDIDDLSKTWLLLARGLKELTDYLDKGLERENLPTTAYFVALWHVHAAGEDGLRQASLSASMPTGRSSAARSAMRLETEGYLERRPSQVDRRNLHLHLTPKGRLICDRGRAVLNDLASNQPPVIMSEKEMTRLILALGTFLDLPPKA